MKVCFFGTLPKQKNKVRGLKDEYGSLDIRPYFPEALESVLSNLGSFPRLESLKIEFGPFGEVFDSSNQLDYWTLLGNVEDLDLDLLPEDPKVGEAWRLAW